MNFITIFLIAVGVAIDAFFIAVAKGMVIESTINRALIIAIFFGGFQALMALGGWIIGIPLQMLVSTLAPWIAFLLISVIGIKMIYESSSDTEFSDNIFSLKEIFILAIATSIDAFVVGISFALLNTPILIPTVTIGVMAFILSFTGVYIGKKLKYVFEKEIGILGGLFLIGIGLFILIDEVFL